MNKCLLAISKALPLYGSQLQFLIEGDCPRVVLILILSEDIPAMQGRMHEIPMHGREERINNLLEVVVQSSLSLPSIGADAILDQIQQQIDTIEISLNPCGPLQLSICVGVLGGSLDSRGSTEAAVRRASTSSLLHLEIESSQDYTSAARCRTLSYNSYKCRFFFYRDFAPAIFLRVLFSDQKVPSSMEHRSTCDRANLGIVSRWSWTGERSARKTVGDTGWWSLSESMRSRMWPKGMRIILGYKSICNCPNPTRLRKDKLDCSKWIMDGGKWRVLKVGYNKVTQMMAFNREARQWFDRVFGQQGVNWLIFCVRFYNSIFLKMKAVQAQLDNPFHRPNPYFIQQRFYSHEKTTPYHYLVPEYSPHRPIRDDRNHAEISHIQRNPPSKPSQLYGSRFEASKKQSQGLRRKNINCIENPFHRKHLLPSSTPDTTTITQDSYSMQVESRHVRMFDSRKAEQPLENNYVKMPSIKSITSEREKENVPAPKYLSSELKIRLKSQAELPPPVPTMLSCGPSKEALVTLGRVQGSMERCSSIQARGMIPQSIKFGNKVYFKQTIHDLD